MKAKTALIVSILIMVAGIILTIVHTMNVFTYIIVSLGIAFIIPAFYNIAKISTEEADITEGVGDKFHRYSGLVSSVGSVILGIIMIGWSGSFEVFLPMIFGIILVLGACFHSFIMALALRPVRLPIWLFSMPIILLALGLVILFVNQNTLTPPTIVLMSGIGLIIFAINSWIELWVMRKINQARAAEAETTNDVIEIEAIEEE